MIENDHEIGLEISLTTYDEGFEDYQQPWRQEQEANDTEIPDQDRRGGVVVLEEVAADQQESKETTKGEAKKRRSTTEKGQQLPQKPSPSSDSTYDGTVSTLDVTFDGENHQGNDNDDHHRHHSLELSSLSAVLSSDLSDHAHDTRLASCKLVLPLPTIGGDEEMEEGQDGEAESEENQLNEDEATFLARLENSRAYMFAFPTTVQDLQNKVNDLLEALHAKDKRCHAAEAELAFVKHQSCLQSEEYRLLYGRAKEEQAKACQLADELARECKKQDAQIQKLQASNEQSLIERQEMEQANQSQIAKLTTDLDEERRQNQQLQSTQEAMARQLENLTAEQTQRNVELEANRAAMAVQTQTVEQLTAEVREWKDRADQLVAETTRLSMENASLTASQEHATARTKAQLDQAQSELQSSRVQWEGNLAAARETTKQVQVQLMERQNRIQELTVEVQEWKTRANQLETTKVRIEQERVAFQTEAEVQGAKVASLTEQLQVQESQLQAANDNVRGLNVKVQQLQGARDEAVQDLAQSRDRIKALEASTDRMQRQLAEAMDRTAAAETQVRVAHQEAAVAKSMTSKLKDTAKRRREMLAMHRNKGPVREEKADWTRESKA